MASWIVMEPPRSGRPSDRPDLAFVRDGFSWLAFLFPPLWLLWHRLWIEAVVAFAVLLSAAALERVDGLAAGASLISLLVSIFTGLEGNGLRIAARRRRGWNFLTVVEADNLDDAETRYAAEAEDDESLADRQPIVPSLVPAGAAPGAPIGLLLNPGR